jgi:hypothetical protein
MRCRVRLLFVRDVDDIIFVAVDASGSRRVVCDAVAGWASSHVHRCRGDAAERRFVVAIHGVG